MSRISGCVAEPSQFNNYIIGSNICNAFAIGDIGAEDDFFIIGAEPIKESNYPIITGNFLDSEGQFLFRLEQNTLIVNPGKCSKVLSDRVGYEIHDSEENLILKVSTHFDFLEKLDYECWVTTIEGNFYNKKAVLVVEANGTEGFIQTNNTFYALELGQGHPLAAIAISSKGKIYTPLSGRHVKEIIELEGKVVMPDAEIEECKVIVRSGNFHMLGGVFRNCGFRTTGEAQQVIDLVKGFLGIPEVNNPR